MTDYSVTFETLQDKSGRDHQIRVERAPAAAPAMPGAFAAPTVWEPRGAFHLETDEPIVPDGSGRWRTERTGLRLFGRLPPRQG